MHEQLPIRLVTPALAQNWLETTSYPGQRPIREHHVHFLANEIRAGRFRLSTLDVRQVGNQRYLINGQHRLRAVIEAGIPVPMFIVVTESESMEEVAKDYAAFDRGLTRSHYDGLSAYNLSEVTGLTPNVLKATSAAAPYIMNGFSRSHINGSGINSARSTQARADFIKRWAEPALLAGATIGESNHTRIRRMYNAPTFSVALVTFRYQPEQAEAFWRGVAENDGLRQGDPRLTLIEFLIDHSVESGKGHYYARAVAACWNAAAENRPLRFVKVLDPNTPIKIIGTPYTGKELLLGDPADDTREQPS